MMKGLPEWYKQFLRGVARVESAGGQLMMNPSSTATGLYGQLYSEVDELPSLEGVTREQFAADTALQNRIMKDRFEGRLPGVPGLLRNAVELTAEYKPQLGEKFTFRPDEVAALTNFLGRQRTREYFASLRDGKPFKPPGVNKTPEDYLKEYNVGFAEVEEQPNRKAFGGRVMKKKDYGQDGMLVQKDPTLVPDPPEDPPSDDVLARLSLGITPPDQQFRLSGGDAPFRTIRQQKDVIAEQESEGDVMEILRYLPVTGEAIDTYELGKVMATGEDIYGQEQDPTTFAAMTAAGYLIPNVLEKPLKSAWRAVKNFPAKMPKKEFRELMGPEKEQVRQNLIQAHEEVYNLGRIDPRVSIDRDVFTTGPGPFNVRQLPSLMSGSKLENAVGKDGLIQVSQIENLINSKDISAVEREALEEVMQTEAFQTLREMGGGNKVDYNKFRDLSRTQISISDMYVDTTNEYADYGLNNLGISNFVEGAGQSSMERTVIADKAKKSARTNLIKHNQADLMSKEYGHFGRDVIGHYRTFERPDEEGVLYISELQADPLQARGPAGKKEVALKFPRAITEDVATLEIARAKEGLRLAELAKTELAAGRSPQQPLRALAQGDGEVNPRILKDVLGQSPRVSPKGDFWYTDYDSSRMRNKEVVVRQSIEEIIAQQKKYIKALEGGWRGGPNAKQANLIKNQDQFLISHILEQEAKGADKLRFPTGETTAKIQGYGNIQDSIDRARANVETEQGALNAMMVDLDTTTGENVPSLLANRVEGMGLSGVDPDRALNFLGRVRANRSMEIDFGPGAELVKKFDNDALKQAYKELKEMTPEDRQLEINFYGGTIERAAEQRAISIKKDVHEYSEQLERIKSQKEHLSRVNASEQATQGIMKGYDRLPKSLKKHGLDATKVTDDAGNTWWEVDIPARLGEGVGEIRAYRKGGQVSDKIRVLKKEGKPQDQAVAIALAMQQKGQL